MKIIGNIPGAHAAKVQLVEIDGKEYILKTEAAEEVASEKFFYKILQENKLNSLSVVEGDFLSPNQLATQYVKDSPTLAKFQKEENFKNWGREIGRMHSINFPACLIMNAPAVPKEISWAEFIGERIQFALRKETDLVANLPKKAHVLLSELLKVELQKYSLLHSDLHINNALIIGNTIFLFDKYGTILSGDPLFDLALMGINFPNHLYVNTDNPKRQNDTELLSTIKEGYGEDFISRDRKRFDSYVLLRGLIRYPSRYEPHIKLIVKKILEIY